MSEVCVIGGGAAGMLASIFAAKNGHKVKVFEKNEKLGKKLFITGKGRCNITNACEIEEFFSQVIANPKFLYSAFYGFSNQDMIEFLKGEGLEVKEERGGRVFPVSDKSSDVIAALTRAMQKNQVEVHLKTPVRQLCIEQKRIKGILLADGREIAADAVIVATGGISYPSTGSTGDGYEFARRAGHRVTEIYPGLVPLEVQEEWVKELMGLSLKNVQVSIFQGKKELYSGFGEMLFTHFGVSGPLFLSASSLVTDAIKKGSLVLSIDLKPALTKEQLDARMLREFEENKNKQVGNVMDAMLPKKLIPVMIAYMGIPIEKRVCEISREERHHMVESLKNFQMTLKGFRGFEEAIITRGGVAVKEIQPSTMESKLVKGLYFIGEVLDLDALTGGFNLQIAWSTAYAAAMGIE